MRNPAFKQYIKLLGYFFEHFLLGGEASSKKNEVNSPKSI